MFPTIGYHTSGVIFAAFAELVKWWSMTSHQYDRQWSAAIKLKRERECITHFRWSADRLRCLQVPSRVSFGWAWNRMCSHTLAHDHTSISCVSKNTLHRIHGQWRLRLCATPDRDRAPYVVGLKNRALNQVVEARSRCIRNTRLVRDTSHTHQTQRRTRPSYIRGAVFRV